MKSRTQNKHYLEIAKIAITTVLILLALYALFIATPSAVLAV